MSKAHIFQIDDVVAFQPIGQAEQIFRIIGQMPAERGTLQYRIRSCTTGQERMVEEAHLKHAPARS